MANTNSIRTIAPSAAEAAHAIVIDCEGRIDHPPAEMGILDPTLGPDAPVRQVVLLASLRLAAQAKGLELTNLESVVGELVERTEREGRCIMGWSSREIQLVRDYCSPRLAARFEALHRDAKKAAKAWRKKEQQPLPKSSVATGASLWRFARLIGYEASSSLWHRGSARTIAILEDAFDRGCTYETLGRGRAAARRKARWTRLLRHNELDCRATYEIAQFVTGGRDHS